jgi:hypothetical protein
VPVVQLAAMRTEQGARAEWQRLRHKIPELLGDRVAEFDEVTYKGQSHWRLVTYDFGNRSEAEDLCRHVVRKGGKCLVRPLHPGQQGAVPQLS